MVGQLCVCVCVCVCVWRGVGLEAHGSGTSGCAFKTSVTRRHSRRCCISFVWASPVPHVAIVLQTPWGSTHLKGAGKRHECSNERHGCSNARVGRKQMSEGITGARRNGAAHQLTGRGLLTPPIRGGFSEVKEKPPLIGGGFLGG